MNTTHKKRDVNLLERLIRRTVAKSEIESVWYYLEGLGDDGQWHEIGPELDTLREARSEMVVVNCWGHKARIVQHFHGFRIVAEKDFRTIRKKRNRLARGVRIETT